MIGARIPLPSHLTLSALTLLALALRVWGLGTSSVTHDEAYGLWVATRPLAEVLPATARDVHPPLYYLLLHGWLALGVPGDTWARLPSALLGTAMVPAVYALGRRLWNAPVGTIAALLMALSPLAVAQAREARMYPLAVLLLVLAAYALLRATQENHVRRWVATIILSALALYTHYYAGLVLLAFACYVFRVTCFVFRTRNPTPRLHPASCILYPAAVAILTLPWLPALADQFSRVRAGFWIPPPSPEAVGKVAQALTFFAVTPRPPTATLEDLAVKAIGAACVAVALLAALAACTGLQTIRKHRLTEIGGRPSAVGRQWAAISGHGNLGLPLFWLLIPPALAYAISLLGPSVFEPRYFAVCLPALLLLVARGITALPGRALQATLSTGLVAASLASLFTLVTFPAYRPPDTRGAASWLRAHTTPGDLVVHTSQVSLRPTVWYNGDDAAGVLADDDARLPARLAAASRIVLVVPYDVRLAAGARQADAAAAQWAAERDLWDLGAVARFWGVHIYEWTIHVSRITYHR